MSFTNNFPAGPYLEEAGKKSVIVKISDSCPCYHPNSRARQLFPDCFIIAHLQCTCTAPAAALLAARLMTVCS